MKSKLHLALLFLLSVTFFPRSTFEDAKRLAIFQQRYVKNRAKLINLKNGNASILAIKHFDSILQENIPTNVLAKMKASTIQPLANNLSDAILIGDVNPLQNEDSNNSDQPSETTDFNNRMVTQIENEAER